MRVLIVFSSSEIGGAERSLTRIALANTGEPKFDLATLDGPGPWIDWCLEQGAEPWVLGERSASEKHGSFGFNALRNLLVLVRRERYDALYVIGLRASFWLRLLRPLMRGAKQVHGIRWNPESDSNLDRVLRIVERVTGWLIDLYICNSHVAANSLTSRAGVSASKIAVVHNGIERRSCKIFPQQSEQQRILTVANLNPRKGYLEYLENVVEPLSSQFPLARFVIVGRDDMSGAVQRRAEALGIAEVIEFAGFLSDASREFERAGLFVLPSLWGEGCPTSILEAMSYGLPVVAFAIDGIPELIEHQVDGFLIEQANYVDMVSEIAKLVASPDESRRMGEQGRDKVANNFEIEKSADKHSDIFKELLQLGHRQ